MIRDFIKKIVEDKSGYSNIYNWHIQDMLIDLMTWMDSGCMYIKMSDKWIRFDLTKEEWEALNKAKKDCVKRTKDKIEKQLMEMYAD